MRMKSTRLLPLFVCVSAAATTKASRNISPSGADFVSRTYDYVVVGGGTAGLALASRLSENPNVLVGVVEAGLYLVGDPLIDTPAYAGQLQGNTKYDWLFQSVPQANLKDRVIALPRGKVLGGSSAINFMVFDRAPKAEYDAWSSFGNPGWDWNGLLPHMKAAEHFTEADPFRVNYTNADPEDIFPSQGTSGSIAASYNSWYSDITVPYSKAVTNLGVPANFDPDSGNPFGIYNSARSVNRTTGKRSYAANTYYAYHDERSNLVVLTGAQATKVEFKNTSGKDGKGKITATGVSFVSSSATFTARAKKEVILSAGSYQTPQLLELSGIGNSTLLRQLGIVPRIDLPGVGENLQDHNFVTSTFELKPGCTTLDVLRNNATFAAAAQTQYASTGDGILAESLSILSFVDLSYIASPSKIANLSSQLTKEVTRDGTTLIQKAQYAIQKQWLKQKLGHIEVVFYPVYFGEGSPKANTSYISLLMVNQHPFSRGNTHINTSDPLAPPQINPNYFSKSIDRDSLVQAVKFGLKISQTEPLASLVVARQDPPPGATTDADIADFVETYARAIHHPMGTAVLAPKSIGGVVDTDLKVYGTSNLRVVDASIIPIHMGTHMQRTVYGIAEKAASIIKKAN